jgi:hypothetical protein
MKPAVSIGGSFIRCPQCDGDGYADDTTGRACPICAVPGALWSYARGWLELPLHPEIAERIYSHGNAAACALVYDAYLDDPSHLILHGPDRIACGVALDGGSAATVDAERVTCPACFVAAKGNRAA